MASIAARLAASPAFERIVAAWNAAATRVNPVVLIVTACAVLTGPLVVFRGYNSDEGLAVSIARTALDDGEWLVPHMFTLRWIERPTLLSWLIAAFSAPFGSVSQITARLTIVAFLLIGCLLIYWLLRRVAASVPAALTGVALFLACPLVIRQSVMITADLSLAVTLFAAFCLWWDGYDKNALNIGRWFSIGLVLAFAGLFKGPQPLGYFALGIGTYVLTTRSWRQIPGLMLAGVISALPLVGWYAAVYAPGDEQSWGIFMRVHPAALFSSPPEALARTIVDILPVALLGGAFLVAQALGGKRVTPRGFVPALACYAFVAAVFVLFWPGGSTPRYYFPLVLPLAVFGGLGYEAFSARRPELVAPTLLITAGLLVYATVYSLASPFLPTRYRQSAIDGARMAALVRASPGPIYRPGDAALNILPYVPGRIVNTTVDAMATVVGPAWLVVPPAQADTLASERPNKVHIVTPIGDDGQWRLLRVEP
jgi:4-amino-4-deoxy-L-arabinose transferase-like glycosyltransferase